MGFPASRKALVVVVGLIAASCAPSDDEHLGVWALETFTVDGEAVDVEVDENAANQPYVEIGDFLSGSAGCNDFRGSEDDPYSFRGGVLVPGESVIEAGLCLPETLMQAEIAFVELLWEHGAIDVAIVGDTMTWGAGGEKLIFTRIDQTPTPPTHPPQTEIGPLDCGPNPLVRRTVPALETDAEQVALDADPRVVEVVVEDQRKLWAEGYDSDRNVILVVTFDDISPETFSIYTCP